MRSAILLLVLFSIAFVSHAKLSKKETKIKGTTCKVTLYDDDDNDPFSSNQDITYSCVDNGAPCKYNYRSLPGDLKEDLKAVKATNCYCTVSLHGEHYLGRTDISLAPGEKKYLSSKWRDGALSFEFTCHL